jgi:predicted nucleotidyltransferase/HEPN domain-containing protein
MKTSLEHLPESKREQLGAVAALLQAGAPVEMVILFGSYARGDWVEDPEGGYYSDFDLLAVVATEEIARKHELWARLSQECRALTGRTAVTLIVHDIKEINHELRLGQYFFIDILREGVELYNSRRCQLASPKALEPAARLKLGLVNFRYWFGSANEFWRGSGYYAGRGLRAQAAFLLHQAVERHYAATLLVFTGYKPKSHNIEELANQGAALHPALEGALPRTEPEDKRRFDLLKRAYIEARYSKSFSITADELRVLRERVLDLAVRVRQACGEKLASFCGPERVGELPEVPASADAGDLPEAPPSDDASAFQAWRDELMALSFDRGFDRGDKQGFDRGKQAGITEGQIQALLAILEARGISVDPETRGKIEACGDPTVLQGWLSRAVSITAAAELFLPEGTPR